MSRFEVLDVAEELFGEHGYDRTSLEQVASGSGFSVGAIYLYFKSKSDLLSAVMERRVIEQARLARDCLSDYGTGLEQLQAMALSSMTYFQNYPAYGRLALSVYVDTLSDFDDYAEGHKTWIRLLSTAINRGQSEGSMRSGDSIWLAQLVSSLIVCHVGLVFASDQQLAIDDLLPIVVRVVS
jgi:AcrR family transcriptional regulator